MNLTFITRPSVGRRIAAGFASLIAMLAAVAWLSMLEIHDVGLRLHRIVEISNPKIDLAYDMLNRINEMAVQTRSITLLTDVQEIDAEAKALSAAIAGYQTSQAALAAKVNEAGATADERRLIKEIDASAHTALPLVQQAAQQGQDGNNVAATTTLMSMVRPTETVWRRKVSELVGVEERSSHAVDDDARVAQLSAMTMTVGLVVAGILLGLLVGWRITRSVQRSIEQAILVAERIADGELGSTIEVTSRDEMGRLLAAIGSMQGRLRELVGEIRRSAESIETASAEVATGNQDLSQRTELAASCLQQTAGSMEQLTGNVRHNAAAAGEADRLASTARTVAMRGGTVVKEVVSTMEEISSSSRRISDIIGVIDGIAFQTNILALNAAVEAARAGEQGRGFAVVAGEVRGLAQRSAEAAKEIKALIGLSVDKVAIGSRLVQDAGATMDEIVASVQHVAHIIGEISVASGEQSAGIGQVNAAVVQLDQMTQQNAALVEQSAAAAESLRDQTARLLSLVEIFRLTA